MTDHRDPMLALNLRVTRAVKDKLDALAAGAGKSRAAVVRALVLRATADDLPAAWVALSDAERAFLADVER